MSTRNFHKDTKGPSGSLLLHDYQYWQETILEKTGIHCTVKMMRDSISILAPNYAEYLQAKNSIKGMTSLPIVDASGNPVDSATPFS